jgi:hypothetical protein
MLLKSAAVTSLVTCIFSVILVVDLGTRDRALFTLETIWILFVFLQFLALVGVGVRVLVASVTRENNDFARWTYNVAFVLTCASLALLATPKRVSGAAVTIAASQGVTFIMYVFCFRSYQRFRAHHLGLPQPTDQEILAAAV